MKRIALLPVVALLCVGCNQPAPGTSRMLGEVSYPAAFAASREALAQHFSIAEANPATGVIETRPREVNAKWERLLGGAEARQRATMRVRRQGGAVVADVTVYVERQDAPVLREMPRPEEDYDSVPNETSSEVAGAVTPDQDRAWRLEKYDHALERSILEDAYQALYAEPRPEPTTRP